MLVGAWAAEVSPGMARVQELFGSAAVCHPTRQNVGLSKGGYVHEDVRGSGGSTILC